MKLKLLLKNALELGLQVLAVAISWLLFIAAHVVVWVQEKADAFRARKARRVHLRTLARLEKEQREREDFEKRLRAAMCVARAISAGAAAFAEAVAQTYPARLGYRPGGISTPGDRGPEFAVPRPEADHGADAVDFLFRRFQHKENPEVAAERQRNTETQARADLDAWVLEMKIKAAEQAGDTEQVLALKRERELKAAERITSEAFVQLNRLRTVNKSYKT